MIIIDNRRKTINGENIFPGSVFQGSIGTHKSTFLRIYRGIVDLVNPQKVWTDRDELPDISDYQAVHAELIISELQ